MTVPCHTDPSVLNAGESTSFNQESIKECNLDKKAAFSYLGDTPYLVLYYN